MLKNFDKCVYTYLHRKEMWYRVYSSALSPADKEVLLARAKVHDMDKMVMYLVTSKADASKIHKKQVGHHMDNELEKTREDRLEAIFDYEASGVKPDKPENAYDVVMNKKPHLKSVLLPLLRELGIDYSYPNTPDVCLQAYLRQFQPVTEQMILDEVFEYLSSLAQDSSADNS